MTLGFTKQPQSGPSQRPLRVVSSLSPPGPSVGFRPMDVRSRHWVHRAAASRRKATTPARTVEDAVSTSSPLAARLAIPALFPICLRYRSATEAVACRRRIGRQLPAHGTTDPWDHAGHSTERQPEDPAGLRRPSPGITLAREALESALRFIVCSRASRLQPVAVS